MFIKEDYAYCRNPFAGISGKVVFLPRYMKKYRYGQ